MADEVDFASLEAVTAAMHFAPVALVVLDRKRTLQRANKMAEAVSCREARLEVMHATDTGERGRSINGDGEEASKW